MLNVRYAVLCFVLFAVVFIIALGSECVVCCFVFLYYCVESLLFSGCVYTLLGFCTCVVLFCVVILFVEGCVVFWLLL